MAYGTSGFAAAVALIMVLSPASAGAIQPAKVYAPAYLKTVSTVGYGSNVYGCAAAKAAKPAWHALTGVITSADSSSAKTCGKSIGYVGGSSSSYASGNVQIAIPFTVGHAGNNSIASSWSLNLASSAAFTAAACPAKNVNYNPGLYQYSYAYCEAGIVLEFSLFTSIHDLNNNSWNANYSDAFAYNDSGWQNYTDCYNYGTPTCYNNTGPFGFQYAFGYNAAGFSTFTWNGATSFTTWNNGTAMVKSHHYYIDISIDIFVDSFAQQANLLGPWSGSASSSLNMATLGNGATLNSITLT